MKSYRSNQIVNLVLLALSLLYGASTLNANEPVELLPPMADGSPRVIFLGFDGIDPILANKWMDAGELPNLRRLRDAGGFAELATISPPQSPAAWSSMLNGTNPGKHGVVGFVRRSKNSYSPELGVIRIEQRELLWGVPGRIGIGVLTLLLGGGLSFFLMRFGSWRGKKRMISASIIGVVSGCALCYASFWVPMKVPSPTSARVGPSYVDHIASAGYRVAALNMPMDWPVPQRENVLEYAGFNVPDLRGTFGIYSFYTTNYTAEEFVKSEMGADVSRLTFERNDDGKEIAHSHLLGARDVMNHEEGYPEVEVPFEIERDAKAQTLTIDMDGVEPFTCKAGEWSAWQSITFHFSPLVSVKARFRCLAEEVSPNVKLYITPLQMDPDAPAGNNAISNPPEFAKQLEDLMMDHDDGPMDTLGWPELTHPVYDENVSDKAFMNHVLSLERRRAEVLYNVLERKEHEMVNAWFFGSDRVCHMMFRYIDAENPLYDALQTSELRDSILDIYRFMDEVVGKVQSEYATDETLLMIGSDHGFAAFRRSVSLNRWLVDNGYLVLKGAQQKRHASDMFNKSRDNLLTEIDWSKTRAYSLGLGKIFINKQGREPQGIVAPEDAEALAMEIQRELEALKDPDFPEAKPVNKVYTRAEAGVHGPLEEDMADLLIGFSRGYRVSWQTTLGYAGEEVVFANDRRWSGDHCSIDPKLIPGVLFCNRRIVSESVSLMDLCPTFLHAFEISIDEDIDGQVIELQALDPLKE